MRPAFLSLAFVVSGFAAIAAEDEIATTADSARQAYSAAIQAAQEKLLLSADDEIKKAAAIGSLELVKSLQQEKLAIEANSSYEPKAVRMKLHHSRYQSEVKLAGDKLRTSLTAAKIAYTKQLKIAEAEAIDAEIKAIGQKAAVTSTATRQPNSPAQNAAPENLKEGLAFLLFERVSGQQGNDGFVEPAKLGPAISGPEVISDISKWSFDASKNAVAYGYLKIEQAGEYEFKTYNFYDRNALYVAGRLVCPYRGSVSGGSDPLGKERITLAKGYASIASIGFVDSKGSVDVAWRPPGQKDFSPIPAGLLFHETKDGKPVNPLIKK